MTYGQSALRFWCLSGTVALALVLVLVNVSLSLSNRSVQTEVDTRQQYVNDSIKINRVSNQLIQTLANVSVQTNDEGIKALLAAHGIQFTVGVSSNLEKGSK